MTYSTDDDVRNVLGSLRDRLPTWVDLPAFREVAYATTLEKLGQAYPAGIPTFDGAAADVVRFAEAKYAAAEILDALRVNLPADSQDQPDRLRASADEALAGGVVGYLPAPADQLPPSPAEDPPVSRMPVASSWTPFSAFPDPYAPARGLGGRFE